MYFILLALLGSLYLRNGIYWFASLVTLLIIIRLLWRPYMPGIFIFCMAFHWLQVFGSVLFATYLDLPLDFRTASNGMAVILSLIGILIVSLAINNMINKTERQSVAKLLISAQFISPRKALLLYIIFYFVSSIVSAVAFTISGLTQILFSISQFKWVFFMLYFYLVLLNKADKRHFILIFLLEFLSGLYSFFSSFKEPIFYSLIVYISFVVNFDIKKFLRLIAGGVVLVYMFIVWTSVKGGYRSFLNKGQEIQAVHVSRGEAFTKLSDMVSKGMSKEEFDYAVVNSLYRLEYTYHFAVTLDRVPTILPHENGSLLLNSILFVLTPRFLNEDKQVLDQSAKTSKYTGIGYAGASKGVSISLGYFAECYIDFGIFGMFIPLFIVGSWIGFIFLYFVRQKGMNILIAFCLANAILINFQAYETDSTILFGRSFISFIIFVILLKFLLPVINNYLKE